MAQQGNKYQPITSIIPTDQEGIFLTKKNVYIEVVSWL